ncbi:sigma E protease regulator RseP [uncultured Neptuniibacter sp.]|uniref:sigma E protease regulator RseP n=1 Tax=uncultured Neptuniibacter sp. TaxID=502143 RepID=UPI00260A3581|nr:sigma E protease regulator RseP [uncultured Neptuniibacter sp.]
MDILHTVVVTLVTLGILVTIHEWGHFYVARRCGVKVLRFSVGFGKAIYTWKDAKGTEYAIAMIPLGGYVKMLDEREGDVRASELSQAFNRKPVLQRIAIVAAGPLVNLIFAVFAYWFMFVYGVTTVAPLVGGVASGSLAEQAELPLNSEIVAIDGHKTLSWDDVNLRLAARVGESGELTLDLREKGTSLVDRHIIVLRDWHVDVDKESPVSAFGLVPWRPQVPAVIGRLVEGGSAVAAGIEIGDRILQVDGSSIDDWYAFVRVVKAQPEGTLKLLIERQGIDINLLLVPDRKVAEDGQVYGYIGAAAEPVSWPEELRRSIQYDLIDAIGKAWNKTLQMISLTLDSIWKMIEGVISVKNLSGPITIAKVASASAASGLESYISFLAYLSISLGILNLLPIPVLDGGHLLFYTVEWITGKPVSEQIQLLGLKIGMAVLLTLMFVALFNDFMRL